MWNILLLISVGLLTGCRSTTPVSRSSTPDSYWVDQSQAQPSVAFTQRHVPTRPSWTGPSNVQDPATDSLLEPVSSSGEAFTSYTVQKGDSLWSLSKRFGVSVAQLAEANHLSKNATIRVGQKLSIPTTSGLVDYRGCPTSIYVVKAGDSLSKIAQRLGTSVQALKSANQLQSDTIRIGQKLKVPSSCEQQANQPAQETLAPIDTQQYTVKPGDTLSLIAARSGTHVADLMAWNQIQDARQLRAGQVLTIPTQQQLIDNEPSGSANVFVPVVEIDESLPVTVVSPQQDLPDGFGDDDWLDATDAVLVVPVEDTR